MIINQIHRWYPPFYSPSQNSHIPGLSCDAFGGEGWWRSPEIRHIHSAEEDPTVCPSPMGMNGWARHGKLWDKVLTKMMIDWFWWENQPSKLMRSDQFIIALIHKKWRSNLIHMFIHKNSHRYSTHWFCNWSFSFWTLAFLPNSGRLLGNLQAATASSTMVSRCW